MEHQDAIINHYKLMTRCLPADIIYWEGLAKGSRASKPNKKLELLGQLLSKRHVFKILRPEPPLEITEFYF